MAVNTKLYIVFDDNLMQLLYACPSLQIEANPNFYTPNLYGLQMNISTRFLCIIAAAPTPPWANMEFKYTPC